MTKDFWNQRYAEKEYAYGEQPNVFFEQELSKIDIVGNLLMPADGEGRNGVFAASKGWNVTSFDISESGKTKAENLAQQNGVQINYQVGDFLEMDFETNSFDAVGLIYAHFPSDIRKVYHQKIGQLLKPGGLIIFEAFSKEHLKYNSLNERVGGPKDEAFLFTKEMMIDEFPKVDIQYLEQLEVDLKEGNYHIGTGNVIRFIANKI